MSTERFTQFPRHREGDMPLHLWSRIYPSIPNPRSDTYISTPLTSGPAKNYMGKEHPNLDPQELTDFSLFLNSRLLDGVADNFPDDDSRLTAPYQLGKINGWGELQYNKFWMNYIAGTPPQTARNFNRHVREKEIIKRRLLNDHTAPVEARLGEYKKLVEAYSSFVMEGELNPVSRMVFMPGHELSLGCTMERMLAAKLNISQEFVIFDSNHAEYQAKVGNQAPWLKDHPQIRGNGGERLVLFSSE